MEAGLLAPGSSSGRAFPPARWQWLLAAFVPGHSGGSAPVLHRLPSGSPRGHLQAPRMVVEPRRPGQDGPRWSAIRGSASRPRGSRNRDAGGLRRRDRSREADAQSDAPAGGRLEGRPVGLVRCRWPPSRSSSTCSSAPCDASIRCPSPRCLSVSTRWRRRRRCSPARRPRLAEDPRAGARHPVGHGGGRAHLVRLAVPAGYAAGLAPLPLVPEEVRQSAAFPAPREVRATGPARRPR